MQLSRNTKLGMWMFTVLAAGFFAIDTRGAYFHWRDEDWSNHAMFHAVTGLFYTQILCALIIILTWIPLKRGERWGWWCVALGGMGIHGGHVVGDQLTDHGLSGAQAAQGEGWIFFAGTLLALTLYIVGLVLTFSHTKRAAK
jgi:hypothetical protein